MRLVFKIVFQNHCQYLFFYGKFQPGFFNLLTDKAFAYVKSIWYLTTRPTMTEQCKQGYTYNSM